MLRRQCTAKSRRSGRRCGNHAIRGKNKCRMHGGKTPIKHGLYSKYVDGTLGERIEDAEKDPRLLDLRRQVAILSALQTRKLEGLKDLDAIPDEELEVARRLTDSITKAIERYEKIQATPENMIPLGLLGELVDLFAQAINHHVRDAAARKRILDALDTGLRLPAPARLH